jgi:hypothetical protein
MAFSSSTRDIKSAVRPENESWKSRPGTTGTAVLMLAFALAASAAMTADVPMRRVVTYGGLATFEIPERWNEIPPDVLEFYTLQSAEISGGLTVELYQHGYRPGNPEADFSPPQILVQIKETGRVGYRRFLKLPPIQAIRDQEESRLDDRMGPMMEDLRIDTLRFDPDTFSIRVTNTLDLKFEGKTMVYSASFLTERGFFTLHCYATIAQHVEMRPIFDHVLSSVRLDDSIRYRPRFSDRLPPRPALVSYGIACALAIAILVVHLVQRRRRST